MEERNGPKSRAGLHPALVALLDVLLAGLILLVFLFFQYGLPILQARQSADRPVPQPAAAAEPITAPDPTVEPTEEPDTRTPWQIQFAEHFTDQTVLTENRYTSPAVSISIETVTVGEGDAQSVYHVADIYVASLDNFCTYTANNELKYYSVQDALEMDADANALLAISGDFYSYQKTGFLVRNGEVYRQDYTYSDICVMFYDGSIETYTHGNYKVDELMEREPYQVWCFGPSLLDEEGKAYDSYQVSTAVSYPNPRSAIGYYEPGHYCFVVVDGRQDGYSRGMTIPELARVFEDLGCTAAYNLDGGGSALMTFNHERYSRQSNGGRQLGDILLVREVEK